MCENLEIDANGFTRRLKTDGTAGVYESYAPDARGVLQKTYFIDVKDIARTGLELRQLRDLIGSLAARRVVLVRARVVRE